jgi:RHS repeat-associated protein
MTHFTKSRRGVWTCTLVLLLNTPFLMQAAPVTTNYSYNSAGFLASVTRNGTVVASYSYDANGNVANVTTSAGSTSYSYDAQDRLLTAGAITFTYTDAGEIKARVAPNGTTSYAYDESGQLRHVSLPDGRNIDYVLGVPTMRIAKKINGAVVQAFLRDDEGAILAELDGSNAVISRFVYSQASAAPEYMIRGSDTFRLVTDSLGSVRLVVNVQNGAIAQRIDYDEWGQITQDSNPGFQPFAYAGGLYDRDTGLVRFGRRDYDASIRRWTAPDPIVFAGGSTNLYSYVNNNPVNLIDLRGTGPKEQERRRKHAERIQSEAERKIARDRERSTWRWLPWAGDHEEAVIEHGKEVAKEIVVHHVSDKVGLGRASTVTSVVTAADEAAQVTNIVLDEATGGAIHKSQEAAKNAGDVSNKNVPKFDPFGFSNY